ncbi:MAG TPA: rod shape-determining protein MreD [Propionibacteriaceae bacterium]|nr:rod shape-determining protein MreD [Propionibacteriaceae bacterium]
MTWLRVPLTVALVVTALLLELTVLPLLHLPGAVPDILTVTVIALGYVGGPVRGAATGLVAGLALDLVTPAVGVLGLSAVVLVAIGYLAGVLGATRDRSPLVTVALTGLLAGAATLLTAVVGGIVADPRISWDRVPGLLVTQILYAVVLAAFVVPAVSALWRRVEPPAPRYEVGRQ